MKHIKIFETTAEYNAFKLTENFVTPNVSLCEDAPTIMHYEPYVAPVGPDPYNGHEYVEIGNIKWATMNVGANSITDAGLYFQWGDTQGYTDAQVGSGEGKKYFVWPGYKYCNGTSSPGVTGMTKYNKTDGKTVLEPSDDAVTAAWGGSWRMPTNEEFDALGNATTSAWTTDYQGSGVSGLVLTDKNDSSKVLFFPAAGCCNGASLTYVGSDGRYWSSSLYTSYVVYGCGPNFNSAGIGWQNSCGRYFGFTVRGVVG